MEFSKFYDIDAETGILGNVIVKNSDILKTTGIITYQDFYSTQNQILYKAMTELYITTL